MRFLSAALGAITLSLAAVAHASPITYLLDHGSVTAKVRLQGTLVAMSSGFLDAGFIAFDPATGEIPSFSLHSSDLTVYAPLLPGAYDGLALDITLSPGSGYSSTASGTGPWSVTLGPIAAAFSGFVLDTTGPITVPPQPVSGVLPINSFGVTAYLSQGQMRLGLLGVKVGEVRIGEHVVDIRADIEFIGFAVPEPALAGLLGLTLVGLTAARSRRT